MKITGVKCPPAPSQTSGGACLVELQTDSTLKGYAHASAAYVAQIELLAQSQLLGEDPRATTALWSRMCATTLPSRAAAALDIALWDLKAKLRDEPLWKALGGARPKVNVHLRWSKERNRQLAQLGFRGVALDISAREHLSAVRDTLRSQSQDPALLIDLHEAYSPKDAIRTIRQLERDFDLTWVEAPAHTWDALGMKRVSDAIRGAVCGGRGLATHQFLMLLHQHALDVVQIDLECTGITGALQIADAAFGFELPVTICSAAGNLGVQLGAVVPYCMSVEITEPVAGGVRVDAGWAIAGDRVGTGVTP